mgnify:CR=1 FL=1
MAMLPEYMLAYPTVFAVGNNYNIFVPFGAEVIMWVKVGDKVYYDDCNGILRSNTNMHKVELPMRVLDAAGEYTVVYKKMIERKPYFPTSEEERELTVMLLIDVSNSLDFGTVKQMKKDMVTEIAATLAFSAIQNNDKIGVIFFSDRIEKFIPPKKGRKHILYIIRELLDFKPESKRTDIKMAVEYLTNVIKKRCVTFMLSDFIDDNDYRNALTIANRKHDIVAIQVYDRRLAELPDVGLMKVRDAETGHEQWIDTSSAKLRNAHHAWWKERQVRLAETFTKSNVDSVSVRTDQDYVKSLLNLFAKRS